MAGRTIDSVVQAAHETAVDLLDLGWKLRSLHYSPTTGAATVTVHTPTHRALSIISSDPATRPPVVGARVEGLPMACRFTDAVADLGRRGGDWLGDLNWLLCDVVGDTGGVTFKRDPIPDPALGAGMQNLPLRTAFWLLSTLVCAYSWKVTHIGEDVAGGGFLADIPGDVATVFPASMPPDGTPAAALATRIPQLDPAGLTYLRNTDPRVFTRVHIDPPS